VAPGQAFDEFARFGHEHDPIVLDQYEQSRTGPDAELLARFPGNDLLLNVTVEGMGAP
jgi:hypothetical protein